MASQQSLFDGAPVVARGVRDPVAVDIETPAPETDAEVSRAVERAGRWLALRARTERELTDRLVEGGFAEGTVRRAIARLKELRLIDDAAFAAQWIEERSRRKGLAGPALVSELVEKGVSREVAEEALASSSLDDDAQAKQVAVRWLPKVIERPVAEQAVKLRAMLARRGFGEEVVERAVRAVLPPHGWD